MVLMVYYSFQNWLVQLHSSLNYFIIAIDKALISGLQNIIIIM